MLTVKDLKKIKAKEYRLLKKYGINLPKWDALYVRQNGKCPICDRDIAHYLDKGKIRAAAVDHDHKSGRIRGLTCIGCNRFKIAKNTAESARKLTDYLASPFDARLL